MWTEPLIRLSSSRPPTCRRYRFRSGFRACPPIAFPSSNSTAEWEESQPSFRLILHCLILASTRPPQQPPQKSRPVSLNVWKRARRPPLPPPWRPGERSSSFSSRWRLPYSSFLIGFGAGASVFWQADASCSCAGSSSAPLVVVPANQASVYSAVFLFHRAPGHLHFPPLRCTRMTPAIHRSCSTSGALRWRRSLSRHVIFVQTLTLESSRQP